MKIDYKARSLTPKQITLAIVCVIASIGFILGSVIYLTSLSIAPNTGIPALLGVLGAIAISVFINNLSKLITHWAQV